MPRSKKTMNGAAGAPAPARSSVKKTNGAITTNDPDAVARRAYEIYQTRGGNHGADLDDWLEAERQLTGQAGTAGASAPAPAKPKRRKTPEKPA